jgi:hypothetical protein
MDPKSATRLRILGLSVLALFFIFAFPAASAVEHLAEPYKNALATTLAIGIGLLLLAEIGPLITSLKAGGVEIQFGDGLTNKFNEFETRLTHLELAVARPRRGKKEAKPSELKPPPALNRRRRRSNDPWKGRFGERAARDGFRLSAEFKNDSRSSVQILLTVTAEEGRPPADLELVEFYLHDTFDPDVVPAAFHDGKAELSLLVNGGFTVGAWIPTAGVEGVELELDLAELPNAPQIVREN